MVATGAERSSQDPKSMNVLIGTNSRSSPPIRLPGGNDVIWRWGKGEGGRPRLEVRWGAWKSSRPGWRGGQEDQPSGPRWLTKAADSRTSAVD